MLLVDFKKAFDSVDHIILLTKLQTFPLPTGVKNLIVSFLTNRYQRVFYNNNEFEYLSINRGVPQGTILGPILFAIFIDDLNPIKNNTMFIKYADDVTVIMPCQAESDGFVDEVNNVLTWAVSNNIEINKTKTKEMVFKFKLSVGFPLLIPDIERVDEVKLLGILINNRLDWKSHINFICKKLAQRSFLIYYFKRNGFSTKELYVLYNALFLPLLTYALSAWGGCNKKSVNSIDMILNRMRKIMPGHNILTFTELLEVSDKSLFDKMVNGDLFLQNFNLQIRSVVNACKLRQRKHNYVLPAVKSYRFKNLFPNRILFKS
jgi:hypothetical protein